MTRVEHGCRESILLITAGMPRVTIWRLENSWCRRLKFLLIYRRRCLKHNYHYGKMRADFINRFKNQINIGARNDVAIRRSVKQQPFCKKKKQRWSWNVLFWYVVLKHWACAEFTQVFVEYVKSNSRQVWEKYGLEVR